MWASVRRYEDNPKLAERLAARGDEIKAIISEAPGFVSYYLIHDGTDTVSVTVAQTQAGVDRSNEIAANWLREHAADIHSSTPPDHRRRGARHHIRLRSRRATRAGPAPN
jgi:hypothetical protein